MTQTQAQSEPVEKDTEGTPKHRLGIVKIAQASVMLVVFLGLVAWSFSNIRRGWLNSQLAPDFTISSFDDTTTSLSQLRGHVVVINFWASWCQPCRQEAAYLEQTWRKYKNQGVVFLGVDYADTEAPARAFIKEFGISYFNGPDLGNRISQAYNVRGIPSTYFVARDGKLRGIQLGVLQPPQLDQKIDELLK